MTASTIAATLLRVWGDFCASWRSLLAAHIAYGLVTFALLAPLATAMIRMLVATSGAAALSDEDILWFIFDPLGLLFFILAVALLIVITALRYAALMTIGLQASQQLPLAYLPALLFVIQRAPAVLRLTVRVIVWVLIYSTPFVLVAGIIYLLLLGQYDINFYLAERPPSFWFALVLISVVVVFMMIVLLRLLVSWAYALPLLLFARLSPATALRTSQQATQGQRGYLSAWLTGWFLSSTVLVAIAVALIDWLADFFVLRLSGDNVTWLIFAFGGTVLLAGFLNLLLIFISESLLSLLLVRLYHQHNSFQELPFPELNADVKRWQLTHPQITGKRLLAGIFVLAVAAFALGLVLLNSLNFDQQAKIIAHRGASAAAPENTLAAVEQAIGDGADWVEIDVQRSSDNEVVVIHDSDLKRVAGSDLKIGDTSYSELKDIDIGSYFSTKYSDQRIPTLQQVIEVAKGRIGVMIELKYYGQDPELAVRVAQIITAIEQAPPFRIISLAPGALQQIRSLQPGWDIGLLSSVLVGDTAGLDVDFFALNAAFVSRSLVKSLHQNGQQVMTWTVNDPVGIYTMLGHGVDGIITDYPEMAVAALNQYADLSLAERLLLQLASMFGQQPRYLQQ